MRLYHALVAVGLLLTAAPAQDSTVDFNRDVRPILANHCFACHGPDAGTRKAGLRLDIREGALRGGKHGAAIVPGDAAASLLLQRVQHANPRKRMPPAKKSDPLSSAEVATLTRWLNAGAPWQGHWAFAPVARRPVPDGMASFVRNDVDRWLSARLESIAMSPAEPADPRTLARRLHFDLLGLPPDPAEVAAFAADPSDANYERMVDRLLASPHHAEQLTTYWLDLVRYADSCGIHGDQVVSMSPYRDWVIRAFQENMPFDRFTREQLAGDLLPQPTIASRTASAYNRLNMKTAEGGAQPAEYLAKYAADRVRTTASVWLGTTLGCAECHDHKFDPFTTKDFYEFAAFFADLDHEGFYGGANWRPKMAVPTAAQATEHSQLKDRIAALEAQLATPTAALVAAQVKWEAATLAALKDDSPPILGAWQSIGPFRRASHRAAFDAKLPPERSPADAPQAAGKQKWRPQPSWKDGVIHKLVGGSSATYVYREIESAREQSVTVSLGSDDALKVWLNGELLLQKFVTRGVRPDQEKLELPLRKGRNRFLMKVTNGSGGYGFYFKLGRTGPPQAVVAAIRKATAKRDDKQKDLVAAHFRSVAKELAPARKALAEAQGALAELEKNMTTVLVSQARPEPRVTRVLPRGNWQDKSGPVVTPGVPGFLRSGEAKSRLDLANWIVAADNPLTARVFVNRLWKLCFGDGLCSTLDDLGTQGDRPNQAELLDWLASEFQRDWNVRRILKMLVMSSAYRQSSQVSPEAAERDPENREFARQGRYRFDAEVVRDQALVASGLLHREVGGKSVKPYQPTGYWKELNFPKRRWVNDTGVKQYRRGMYTHWQRTFLHPSMRAFDAPSREECTAERPRSNTPLQALALLNDPTYVEAARVFAARILQRGGVTTSDRLGFAFRTVLMRPPTEREERTLTALFEQQQRRYDADPAAARKLTSVGMAPVAKELDVIDHAAWTAVARVFLNLHETITRY